MSRRQDSFSSVLLHLLVLGLVVSLGLLGGCADEDGGGRTDIVVGDDVSEPGGDTAADEDVTVAPAELVAISYVNEWADDAPVHDGERVTIEGIATVNSGVIVSGRYLKFHLQDDTGGVAIFADTEATVDSDGYDGSVFADLFVRRGDEVRVTGTVSSHSGLVEFLPTEAGSIEILSQANPVPDPLLFDSVDDLYAAGRDAIGRLVEVRNLSLTEDNPWPSVGQKQKDLGFVDADAAGTAIGADIYPASGIPGSLAPEAPFTLRGLCRVDGDLFEVFPRDIADVNPVDNDLDGSVRVTRYDDAEWGYDVDISTLPAFRYDGRTAVLFYTLLDPSEVPAPQDFAYKNIARDDRQPFATIDHVQARQAMFVQTMDDDEPVAGSLDTIFYESLDLSEIHFLEDVDELRLFPVDSVGPVVGEGACDEGINVAIQGEVFHTSFDDMPLQSVEIDGDSVEAVALEDLLSDAIVSRYSFDGFLAPEHVRALYDIHLDAEDSEGPMVSPEALAVAWYVPADESVRFADETLAPAEAVPTGLCHLRAERRFIVRRGEEAVTLHLSELAGLSETINTPDGEDDGIALPDMIEQSGLVADEESTSSFNYRLIASDYPGGVVFPWGHDHLTALYWWDTGMKTTSVDVVGDLLDGDGEASYGGVSGSGWSSVKALLYVDLEPLTDEGGALIEPDMDTYPDPATCTGCHAKRGEVVIPVTCTQCHN